MRYLTRFLRLKQTRFTNPSSYFHRFAGISDDEVGWISDVLLSARP